MRRKLNIDWFTLILYALLVTAGWLNLYSLSSDTGSSVFNLDTYHGKQLFFILVSIGLGVLVMLLDTKFLEFLSYGVYGAALLALIGVLIVGTATKGATSWFNLGGFSLQPSEFAKIATLMALGKFMSRHNYSMAKLSDLLISIGLVVVPMLVILLQNDAGSALVFFSLIIMFYREGLHPLMLVTIGLTGAVGVATLLLADLPFGPLYILLPLALIIGVSLYFQKGKFAGIHVGVFVYFAVIIFSLNVLVKDYQRARIQVLVASEEAIKASPALKKVAYNLRESKVAIGSGGLWGKGYGNATHTKGDFVPEEHTDYIFCVVGEEHGWTGSALVLTLLFMMVARILYLAENSKSRYSRIYGYGAASILFFHILINVGMTIGLIPTVGIPLPFFSYGGSSMLAFSLMIFILINHYNYRVNILGDKTI